MKTGREILSGGLLALALSMTLGSVLAPSAEAEIVCKASANEVCVVGLRDEVWVFEDYRLVDEELD